MALVGCHALRVAAGDAGYNERFVNIHPTTSLVNDFWHSTPSRKTDFGKAGIDWAFTEKRVAVSPKISFRAQRLHLFVLERTPGTHNNAANAAALISLTSTCSVVYPLPQALFYHNKQIAARQ
jgi:hypothetical protein